MKRLWLLALLLLIPASARADERSAARRFREARADEPSLIAFLRSFPKGADLHNHAGGAIYAEHGLDEAVRHGLFFDPQANRFSRERGERGIPAAELLRNDRLRYQYLGAATIRNGFSGPTGGHDHFFGGVFGALNSPWQATRAEEELATLARRARIQNVQYLELMASPGGETLDRIMRAVASGDSHDRMLEKVRPLLEPWIREAKTELDGWDRETARLVGLPAPLSAGRNPLTLRYLASAGRTAPDAQIFAFTAAMMALMREDRRLVGMNLVAPEDHPIARAGFDRHMLIYDFLWSRFDRPNVTLHAGELNLFLSPLEDMTHHIRRSIEVGHARRIGHGTAVAWEDDCPGLLRKMREERIAVEVCPTSEAVILGVEGERHPFRMYRRAGVPVVLCTDDEGVLRTNLTLEWVRAVRDWNLTYTDLKELARNSIEYAFLPGESLWEKGDYRRLRAPFRSLRDRAWVPNAEDERLLDRSEKAWVQARLERALVEFEGGS